MCVCACVRACMLSVCVYVCVYVYIKFWPPNNFQTSQPIDTKFRIHILSFRSSLMPLIRFLILKIVSRKNFLLSFLLSSDIRSEGSIAIVKKFDFEFLMIFHSTSLPKSKNVFWKKCLCVCVCVCVCVCLSVCV